MFVARWVPALALWAAEKALERPKVKRVANRVDARVREKQEDAGAAIRRARRNAMSNRTWLLAGAGAIAVGIALIGRATRPK